MAAKTERCTHVSVLQFHDLVLEEMLSRPSLLLSLSQEITPMIGKYDYDWQYVSESTKRY